MRQLLVTCLGLGLLWATGCRRSQPEAPSELWLGWHFVGAAAIGSDAEAGRVREIWSLPASLELRSQTLDKLARAPLAIFSASASLSAEQRAALMRPLLADLLQAESYAEVRGRTNEPPLCTLAIRLDDERAAAWRTSLHELATGLKLDPPTVSDWVQRPPASPGGPTNHFAFARAGEWVVISLGRAEGPPRPPELAQKIKTAGRPIAAATNYWLQAEVNLPRLAPWLPPGFAADGPVARVTLHCKEDFLRTNVRLLYPRPQSWPLDPWSIPLGTITDPPKNQMTSFVAARGFGPWLAAQPIATELGLSPAPNQLFVWSHTLVPFHTFFAVPVGDATNVLTRLADWLPVRLPRFLAASGATEVQWTTNRAELLLPKLPFTLPFCRVAREAGGEFVTGGLLPPIPSTNPPPAELLNEITSRPNLLCYEWEVSQARLLHWRAIAQLCSIVVGQKPGTTNLVSQRWIEAIAPTLDNTVTIATVESPEELSLARKSRLGLSSLELVLLAHWLDDPAFPAWQVPAAFRESTDAAAAPIAPPPADAPAKDPAPAKAAAVK